MADAREALQSTSCVLIKLRMVQQSKAARKQDQRTQPDRAGQYVQCIVDHVDDGEQAPLQPGVTAQAQARDQTPAAGIRRQAMCDPKIAATTKDRRHRAIQARPPLVPSARAHRNCGSTAACQLPAIAAASKGSHDTAARDATIAISLIFVAEGANEASRLFGAIQSRKHDAPNGRIAVASKVKRTATTATSADIREGP
jgi:hypothetical protein